jgi:malate dehydrogenase (oxaloacetate-decarboxylating)
MFRLLREAGCKDIIVVDSIGALYEGRTKGIDSPYQKEIAINTNLKKLSGTLSEVIEGADVFIGVSGKGDILSKEMVKSMCSKPVVFALSSEPEIPPSHVKEVKAIVATSRSDFANQVDSAIVFPSIVRAILDMRVGTLSEEMLMPIATAIADMIPSSQLKYDYIIPRVNDPRLISIITDTLKNSIRRPR